MNKTTQPQVGGAIMNDRQALRSTLRLVMRHKKLTLLQDGKAKNAMAGWIMAFIVSILLWALIFSWLVKSASAEVYDSELIADAIIQAEGNPNYGVLSVRCGTESECRAVCIRTVDNTFTRWQIAGSKGNFLEYLAKRYAPINSDTDNGTNQFWLKNVKYFLSKGGS